MKCENPTCDREKNCVLKHARTCGSKECGRWLSKWHYNNRLALKGKKNHSGENRNCRICGEEFVAKSILHTICKKNECEKKRQNEANKNYYKYNKRPLPRIIKGECKKCGFVFEFVQIEVGKRKPKLCPKCTKSPKQNSDLTKISSTDSSIQRELKKAIKEGRKIGNNLELLDDLKMLLMGEINFEKTKRVFIRLGIN